MRDCDNCTHKHDSGCESWDCEFKPTGIVNDFISRQDALNTIYHMGHDGVVYHNDVTAERLFTVQKYEEGIKNIPGADVREKVKGEWIEEEVEADIAIAEWQSAKCSVCGRYHTTPYLYNFDEFNYCPNCGADMRGEGK